MTDNKLIEGLELVDTSKANVVVPFGFARLDIAKLAMKALVGNTALNLPMKDGNVIRDLMPAEQIADYAFKVADAMLKKYAEGSIKKDNRF